MFLLHVLVFLFCDGQASLLATKCIFIMPNMMTSCCVRGSSIMMDIPCVFMEPNPGTVCASFVRPTEESMTPKVVSVGRIWPIRVFLEVIRLEGV